MGLDNLSPAMLIRMKVFFATAVSRFQIAPRTEIAFWTPYAARTRNTLRRSIGGVLVLRLIADFISDCVSPRVCEVDLLDLKTVWIRFEGGRFDKEPLLRLRFREYLDIVKWEIW